MNPLQALQSYGQSVWLDYIRRHLLVSGELQRLVDEDGLGGVTSNPAIFEKAISGSTDYREALRALAGQPLDAAALYERLAIQDIQAAADILRPVYERTHGADGYVSLEVSPHLAFDTQGTIAEAKRLWQAVGRPNLMIKVPATPEGLPAFEQLIGAGINVNVTLLFAQEVYEQVAHAYLAGLERWAAQGGDLSRVASVASFFISRIDTAVDAIVAARLKTAEDARERALLRSIMGKVAIANAKLTYQRFKEIFRGPRWEALAAKGARRQRLLWASTSTKNPRYRDVLYVEELIGPDTVNTMPPATLEAFRDHGRVHPSLEEDLEGAHDTMAALEQLGISMRQVTEQLLAEGVRLFADPFDKLLDALAQHGRIRAEGHRARLAYRLPGELESAVQTALEDWRVNDKVRRLWARDASLWTGADEGEWLGWLSLTEDRLAHLTHLQSLAQEVREAGFSQALLMGMGGSSLAPEVLRMTFGRIEGFPELLVLDSTDPAQIRRFEQRLDLANTLFLVSSKSGTTLEPNIFLQYFLRRVQETVGAAKAGRQFIAITDPGSKLQQIAESQGFRHIFFGIPSVGGRYSALSDFGLVPAAVMGLDVRRLLDRADEMVQACAAVVAPPDNPGVVVGAILGVLAKQGRDKVTLIASPPLWDLGAWLEQLLAESTGKEGRGLIPVDGEPVGAPQVYGQDRLFVYLRLESAPDAGQDAAVAALERAGQPVVRLAIGDLYDLGQEFFRWEFATAVAGSILGINPFDQPDVEASKVATWKLTAEYEKTGLLPPETPLFEGDGLQLFADDRNAQELKRVVGPSPSLPGYLKAHLNRLRPGDYLALLAYVDMHDAHRAQLQTLRRAVRDAKRVATCLGFGPRFLHSTGQAYKGGPNSGVFLQITCDDAVDVPVPGQAYTFGVVKAAQARGDFQVLAERQRRALRVHLGKDVLAGLARLAEALTQALA